MKRYLLSGRMLANVLVLGLLGVWFLTLGPTAFGGPAAYVEVSGHSMDGTYKTGDLILTRAQDTYDKGDIVTYKVNGNQQVIHRIIGGDGVKGYTLQGDNNPDPDPWHPTDAEVVGKSWHRFEGKAWLLHLPQRPWFIGMTAGLLTLLVLGLDSKPRRREDDPEAPVENTDEADTDDFLTAVGLTPQVPAQRVDSLPAPATSVRRGTRANADASESEPTTSQPPVGSLEDGPR
jgi:signal peptidase